jgi:hypothetical protein
MTLVLGLVLAAAACLLALSVVMTVWLAHQDPRDDLSDYWYESLRADDGRESYDLGARCETMLNPCGWCRNVK